MKAGQTITRLKKGLTKQELLDDNISIEWDETVNNWKVTRLSRNHKSVILTLKTLKEHRFKCKHKYAPTKEYPGYAWSKSGSHGYHTTTIPTSRLVYAYFVGDIPDGYEVDHIDNNPFNNSLENLRILTKEENLKKRYSDNPDMCNNHHEYCKKHNIPEKK